MKNYRMLYCGKERTVRLRIVNYANNGNLAIRIDSKIGASRWQAGRMLTVNVISQIGPEFALIDTNNMGDHMVPWLEDNGLAISTGWAERSGFCLYPQVMFFEEALEEADPKGYREHIRQWEERNAGGNQGCGGEKADIPFSENGHE